jgi:hypothetical protein
MSKVLLKLNKVVDSNSEIFFDLFKNKELFLNINKKDISVFLKTLFSELSKVTKKDKNEINLSILIKKQFSIFSFKKGLVFKNDFNFDNFFIEEYINNRFLRCLNNSIKIENEEIFYSCNYPEEKEGFNIIEVDEDLYKYEKKFKFEDYKATNKTHYLKWVFNNDISIRYFYQFESDKDKENKFFLKSHSKKIYIPLYEGQAKLMIDQMGFKDPIEIFGKLVNGSYMKSVNNIKFEKEKK